MGKKISVDTSREKGLLFEVKESGGTFYAYRKGNCIGKSRSFEDAIVIIKVKAAESYGEVRKVTIE